MVLSYSTIGALTSAASIACSQQPFAITPRACIGAGIIQVIHMGAILDVTSVETATVGKTQRHAIRLGATQQPASNVLGNKPSSLVDDSWSSLLFGVARCGWSKSRFRPE